MINRDLSSSCSIYRYDVELYQRIEQLIGKKLPLYPTVEEEVMLLMERVTEAQRYAKMVRIPPHLTPYIQVCLYVTCVCS